MERSLGNALFGGILRFQGIFTTVGEDIREYKVFLYNF